MTEPGFKIEPARYCGRHGRGQPMVAVHCESDGSGYKTRAMRLCAALKGRWVNRERAYIMSAAKARRFQELFAAGRDAELRYVHGKLGWVA